MFFAGIGGRVLLRQLNDSCGCLVGVLVIWCFRLAQVLKMSLLRVVRNHATAKAPERSENYNTGCTYTDKVSETGASEG